MFATPMLSIGTYVNFLLGFLPPFGIMFELPVLVIWLARLGLVTSAQMRKGRKYVILGLFTVAAVLTPPDVVSQVMLGLPLLALYEIGILCAKVVESR
jgi:sec-independent protein translocase protein TatC